MWYKNVSNSETATILVGSFWRNASQTLVSYVTLEESNLVVVNDFIILPVGVTQGF